MEDNGEKQLMLFKGVITYVFFTQSYCNNVQLFSVTDLSRDNRFPSRTTFLLAFSLNYFLIVFLTSLRWAVGLKEIISLKRTGVTSKPGPHPGRFWVSPRTDWTDPALQSRLHMSSAAAALWTCTGLTPVRQSFFSQDSQSRPRTPDVVSQMLQREE